MLIKKLGDFPPINSKIIWPRKHKILSKTSGFHCTAIIIEQKEEICNKIFGVINNTSEPTSPIFCGLPFFIYLLKYPGWSNSTNALGCARSYKTGLNRLPNAKIFEPSGLNLAHMADLFRIFLSPYFKMGLLGLRKSNKVTPSSWLAVRKGEEKLIGG